MVQMRSSRKSQGHGMQTHTSFVDSDLEVKSWAQAMKHFSTRPEYKRIKSCIWASAKLHNCFASLRRGAWRC